MIMIYAPIMIPTLCRSMQFIRQIESLKKNSWAKYTDVYIGLDYPPSPKYQKGWEEICEYLSDKRRFIAFASFTVFKRETNYGALRNALELRNEVLKRHDRWIRTDDDCEFSPNFIEYMDKCLEQYEYDPDVVAVTGYSYPVKWKVSGGATCMKQNFNCSMWGTGFWKSKMKSYYDFIMSGQMLKDVGVVVKDRRYEKMTDAAKSEYFPAATSWNPQRYSLMMRPTDLAMRSYLAVSDKYVIIPVISKARNLGFDGSGMYCGAITIETHGKHADNYDYSNQPIDSNLTFEIIEDPILDLDVNLTLLNEFDRRTNEQMRFTRFLIYMLSHFGVKITRVAHVCYKMIEKVGFVKNVEKHILKKLHP